jgi:hypothetical protein
MEKSIEQIWKGGFMNNKELKAPKINALYNQKSINLVDRLINNMKTELFTVIILGFIIALFITIAGNHIIWGILLLLINSVWYIISKKQLKDLNDTQFNSNCYEYLIEISKKIKKIARINKRNTILSVPLTLIPILVYTYYNNQDKTLGQILGIDIDLSKSYLFILIPIAMLIAYGLYIIYLKFNNRIENKITSLIIDMEELKE